VSQPDIIKFAYLNDDFVVGHVAVQLDLKYYDILSDRLKNDKQIAMAVVEENGSMLKLIPNKFTDDEDIVLEALKDDYEILTEYISDRLKNLKHIVKAILNTNGCYLKKTLSEFKKDKELVLAAIKNSNTALYYADKELQNDQDCKHAYIARKQYEESIETWAEEKLSLKPDEEQFYLFPWSFNDKQFLLENAWRLSPLQFMKISDELLDDKQFVIEMISQNGILIQHIKYEFQSDIDVLSAAVKNLFYILGYVDNKIRYNVDIIEKLIDVEFRIFDTVPYEVLKNKNIAMKFISADPSLWDILPEDTAEDPDILQHRDDVEKIYFKDG
jgi:hypothetical protein